MCGRFTLRAPAGVVAEQFSLLLMPLLEARFNIAPSQPVPVVRMTPGHEPPQRQLVLLHWGLIPSWADDPAIGNRLINARAETAADKPSFRTALRRRRCLVVADGFYEWQRIDRRRQPFWIGMRDDKPFGFAGLWESWEGPDHSAIESCTILTTEANDLVRPIHDRMPVIVEEADYSRWLDPAVDRPEPLRPLLRPYPSGPMTAYPVSSQVNNPANDDPRCVEPMASKGASQGLF
jgi:putative SOS response-associated peptidase YedK